jgi:hypothetical protein
MPKSRRKAPQCPNCGNTLKTDDNFCSGCGQKNHDLRVPFRHLLMEALEGIIHFDSKSFKTIYTLLFKPGSLTNEFKAGRRTSFVPPIRLYIFLSFIFFLALSMTVPATDAELNSEGTTAETGNKLNISFFNIPASDLGGLTSAQIDSLMQARGIRQTGFNKYMVRQVARLNREGQTEFIHRLLKGISYMMFALMPIFALLLYLLFRKRAEYYIDCLVFSVHYHSFAFLLFTLYLILGYFADITWLILILPLILGVYCYLGFRAVFQQSWLRTALKTILTGLLYSTAIVVCFILTLLVSLALF